MSPDSDPNIRPAKRLKVEAKAGSDAKQNIEGGSEPKAKQRVRRKKGPPPEPTPEEFVHRVTNSWKIGPHVSSGGGIENSIVNAAAVGYV